MDGKTLELKLKLTEAVLADLSFGQRIRWEVYLVEAGVTHDTDTVLSNILAGSTIPIPVGQGERVRVR